ncbi:MAG: response regulator [Thermodesulfobacteriota bacterium]|nr:response regulator [Thermodesulfobacteriota bacterium]
MKHAEDDGKDGMKKRLVLLETQVKHLGNDLRLTKEENENSTRRYFEIYSNMERKVEERTAELRGLQKELEEKTAELEIMLDSSPAMIFYKDTEQRYIRVNRRFAEGLGVSVDDIIGKTTEEAFLGKGSFGQEDDSEVLQIGQPILNRYEVISTPEGERNVLVDRIPHKDSDGKVRGIISFALDVTEAQRMEEEKRKLKAQFEKSQRLEAIGTLAGGIAHNFNNLLMGIQGSTTLIMEDIEPSHPHHEILKVVEKLIQNGSRLTRQLLGCAREGLYEIKPLSLNQLVRDTLETFGSTKKDITIEEELADDLLAVEADQGQVEQLLLNLCVNAAEAMPEGGGLYVKTMNVTHKDMAHKSYKAKRGDYVLLSFRDTGVGMDSKTMEHIFEPFFTSRGFGKGTGLGLASVYGIVKAHGGYIDVYSEEGFGATFEIYLRAVEREIPKERVAQIELSEGSQTVLLVDDETMVANVGNKMLKKLGYEVVIANSGKEALKLYEPNCDNIDMVILDMIMPDMNGGQVYDRIKRVNPDAKVLLSSGYSIDGQAADIMKRGCDGFIQKPFGLRELSGRIREVLEGR